MVTAGPCLLISSTCRRSSARSWRGDPRTRSKGQAGFLWQGAIHSLLLCCDGIPNLSNRLRAWRHCQFPIDRGNHCHSHAGKMDHCHDRGPRLVLAHDMADNMGVDPAPGRCHARCNPCSVSHRTLPTFSHLQTTLRIAAGERWSDFRPVGKRRRGEHGGGFASGAGHHSRPRASPFTEYSYRVSAHLVKAYWWAAAESLALETLPEDRAGELCEEATRGRNASHHLQVKAALALLYDVLGTNNSFAQPGSEFAPEKSSCVITSLEFVCSRCYGFRPSAARRRPSGCSAPVYRSLPLCAGPPSPFGSRTTSLPPEDPMTDAGWRIAILDLAEAMPTSGKNTARANAFFAAPLFTRVNKASNINGAKPQDTG